VTATETASVGQGGRRLIVASVSLGLFAAALDTTVNVALPAMSQSLGASLPSLQWIIIAFVATNTALSVGAGSAADRFGAERFFLGGLVLYALAMLLIALAPNLQVLVALRVLQGVAAAAVLTVGPVLVAAVFPPGVRGRVLGATASAQAVGMVASGFAGGLLVQAFGWPSIFLARLPFLLVAFALALLVLRGRRIAAGVPGAASERRFDLAGALVLVVTLGALLLGLNLLAGTGGALPVGLLLLAAASASAFVWVERRASWPILDLALFGRRPFAVAVGAQFLVTLGAFTIFFIFPFFVADVLGHGARSLGVLFGVQGLAMAISSPLAGRLCDRVQPARVMTAAGASIAGALVWIAGLPADSGLAAAALPLVLAGAGQGAMATAAWTLVFNSVPGERSGTGSGALNLGRSMGVVLSVALFSAIFAARQEVHLAALPLEAPVEAFRETFRLAALVVVAGVACTVPGWRDSEAAR
jgi:EmrB/QacA subfamily drug resistance transporter